MTAQGIQETPQGYPQEAVDQCIELALELGIIPAPSGAEMGRAERVAQWWRERDLRDVHIDAVGNVWARIGEGADSGLVVTAHLDTVFGSQEPHEFTRGEDRIVGPSIGDNSVAVAGTTVIASAHQKQRLPVAYWLVGTAGEEGLGNLAGIRHVFAEYGEHIRAVVAVEGHFFGRIGVSGVGSQRYRLSFGGPGGHSWEHRNRPSAVHQALRFGHRYLERCKVLSGLAVNVGTVVGGEGITRRAQRCSMQIDVRSVVPEVLNRARAEMSAAIAELDATTTPVSLEVLGERPAGGTDPGHPLVIGAVRAHRAHGLEADIVEASTDANLAYEAGVPAISMGVTKGGDEHTHHEWISLAELSSGLAILAEVIANSASWCTR